MTIGVDLDEVLAGCLSAIIDYHNFTYHTTLVREQFHSYNLWEVWGGTKDEAIQKVYDFFQSPFAKQIQPISGAKEGVTALKNDHDLVIITSRPHDVALITHEWINKYFPNCFKGVNFANHFAKNGQPVSKATICDNLGVQIFIEDAAHYALECVKPGRKVLLFNNPWNKGVILPKGINRVCSWVEIANCLK